MRISIITGFFLPVPPVLGGSTEKIWYRLALDLARRGHSVTVISRSWPGFAREETVGGVRYRRLPGAAHSRFLGLNLLRDLVWGVRVARALPPRDVVICNTVTLPIWLRRLKPTAGRVIAVIARMPKGHGRAYGGVDRLFALSTSVAAALRQENPALATRTAIVPYPIDWAQLASGPARPESTIVTIGFIGRVHPEKGIELLLQAASRLTEFSDLPAWQLEIVGPVSIPAGGGGEAWFRPLLEKYGRKLGSRLVISPAEFDPERLARRYGAIDIFCYPSLAAKGETFGLAVAEAMAAGSVPVVSALDCFQDLVSPGETGISFDQTAVDADRRLAQALADLLRSPSARATLRQKAQASVRRFDYQAVADTVVKELELAVQSQ